MNHKRKHAAPIVAALGLFASASIADADTIYPTQLLVVSDATSSSSLGTVDAGSLTSFGLEYYVRGQSDTAEDSKQVASFLQFDNVFTLPAFFANQPGFSATFGIRYMAKESSTESGSVMLGTNASGSWDASGSNNPLFDWGFDDDAALTNAANVQTLIPDVASSTPTGTLIEIDVTDIVRDWINNPSSNQGFVLFLDENSEQGASFKKAQIELSFVEVPIPEPSTLALMGLGGLFMARRRRDRD